MTYKHQSHAFERDSGLSQSGVVHSAVFHEDEVGRLRAERDLLLWLLAKRDAEIVQLRDQLQDVENAEQRRIARELHDGVAQLASAAHLQLQALATMYRPRSGASREAFEQALSLTRRAAVEVRRMIAGAPPEALQDCRLADAVEAEVMALRADGWHVVAEIAVPGSLPTEIELALFRLAQEMLQNIRKHAGRCRVWFRLSREGAALSLEVSDHGRGFDPGVAACDRYGIAGMRERAALLGGTLDLWSQPGAGTRARVSIPLPEFTQGDIV